MYVFEGFAGGKAMGAVAQRLLQAGMNTNALRTNATLRKDEWKQYDTAVIKSAQQRLVGVADLMSRGLTFSIPNGLGKTVLEYETQSEITGAQLSMDGQNRGQNDRPEYDMAYLPLPIVHKDFQIGARALAASRNGNTPLDTTMAELAARKVAEKLEEMLFTGTSSYSFGGGTIYGYVDYPYSIPHSLIAHWDDSGADPVADVRAMKQLSIGSRHYGPWVLYVPTAYETVLDDDYVSGYPKTIRARILEIEGIQACRVADFLTADKVLLVQMTSDVVRLVEAMPITTVEWDAEGSMIFLFKIMGIIVPQLRADQSNRTGIVLGA